MKEAFHRIPKEKQDKILGACIDEFSRYGYEKGSTDRIIKKAGISKGGLYEYIASKEELFLYVVKYSYDELYGYLKWRIKTDRPVPPTDIMERIRIYSSFTLDFYTSHPHYITLINRTYRMDEKHLEREIKDYALGELLPLFEGLDESRFRFPKVKVIDLICWFILKARQDFLVQMEEKRSLREIRESFLQSCDFYISILSEGLYK